MDKQLKAKLKEWAGTYNVKSFIPDDPVQFPHRFTEKRDIEISAFITSWFSYGRRELILRKADWLHSRMGGSPYEWILSGRYRELVSEVPAGKRDTFYRFYQMATLYQWHIHWMISVPVIFCITIALSLLSYYYFEKPDNRWVKRILTKKQS